MEQIFLDIQQWIAANVPEILYTDFDDYQLEAYDMPPVQFPCALVSFPNIRYENRGHKTQEAKVTVNIRVAFLVHERPDNYTPDTWKQVALQHWNILRKLGQLHGTRGDKYSALIRQSLTKEKRIDLQVYSLLFDTITIDADLMPTSVAVAPALKINLIN